MRKIKLRLFGDVIREWCPNCSCGWPQDVYLLVMCRSNFGFVELRKLGYTANIGKTICAKIKGE